MTDRDRHRQTDTNKQTDRQTDSWTAKRDILTERRLVQTDRRTDRQIYRDGKTEWKRKTETETQRKRQIQT